MAENNRQPNEKLTLTRENSFWTKRPVVYARSFVVNFLVYGCVFYLAFLIKYDSFPWSFFWKALPWALAIKLLVLFAARSYRNIGYYATFRELYSIVVDSVVGFAGIVLFFKIGHHLGIFKDNLSFSVAVLDMIFSIVARGGGRMVKRFYFESIAPTFEGNPDDEPAFLVGANSRGARVANGINTQRNVGVRVVGFLTIHEYKVKMRLGSLPVVANVDDFVPVAKKAKVKTILFIAGSLPGKVFRALYEKCDQNGLVLRVVPQVEYYPDTKIPIRDVDVNDLLKRDPVRLDDEQIRALVSGKRVLVTGAGGSIGSEICRQLARFAPGELFILGRGENRIFFLDRELRSTNPKVKVTPIIADVQNAERIDGVFQATRPELVFHAAAHKHVPLMEANACEAIRNNIYGTKVVADCSDKYGVEKFVMVSTDKAVNPSSVMGCSKQMAERYVNALAVRSKTKFIVTRFGNVLGSNGSVVPIFTKQIENGGPITITDKRMTRYFMTIPEASQLVLDAAAMGKGGEIFVLDMGEPVRIMELAKDLVRLSGLPERAIEIQEVGLRPGEKLYEELYFETETRIPTTQKKLFAAQHRQFDLDEVQKQIDELLSMTSRTSDEIRARLRDFVPEYKPTVLPKNGSAPQNESDSRKGDEKK